MNEILNNDVYFLCIIFITITLPLIVFGIVDELMTRTR